MSFEGSETLMARSPCSGRMHLQTVQRWLPVSVHYDGEKFWTREEGVLKATPLLLVLWVIELTGAPSVACVVAISSGFERAAHVRSA